MLEDVLTGDVVVVWAENESNQIEIQYSGNDILKKT